MSADLEMIAQIPMFELLDESERVTLAELLETRHFDKGSTIFSTGDVGDEVFIVREGRVEVFVEDTEGRKIILGEQEHGDLFGEISLLDGGPRTATAVAVEDTETLTLDRDLLLKFVSEHPHAALDLLTVMGRRLRATDQLLRTQVSRNVNEEEEDRLTFGERIADKVAAFGGSWTFIILFGGILIIWMAVNAFILRSNAFDPYPFILLNLVLSTLAALQAPVIMMSQNRQGFKDRIKADMDYQVNLKAELEVAQLHHKLDKVYEEMQQHFSQLKKEAKAAL